MFRRRLAAAFLAAMAVSAWTGGAQTLEGTTQSGGAASDVQRVLDERFMIQQAQLAEQARQANASLLEHHRQVVEQREVVQEVSADHHERTSDALGARAPTETVPPMPTVPPLVD